MSERGSMPPVLRFSLSARRAATWASCSRVQRWRRALTAASRPVCPAQLRAFTAAVSSASDAAMSPRDKNRYGGSGTPCDP